MLAAPRERLMTVWSRIEQRLAADIARGRYRPGERLETEHRLAGRFGVNRHTVRQALGSLAAKGLVRVERGRGTFVADFAVDYVLGSRTRFSENLAAAGFAGRHRLMETREIAADREIACELGLRRGARVFLLVTLGEARGRPIVFGEHYFPAARFPGLEGHFRETGSISRALARLGVSDYTRRRSVVRARQPDAAVAARLGQSRATPAFYVESVNVDGDGQPIEFARTWFSGDRVQLVVEPGR